MFTLLESLVLWDSVLFLFFSSWEILRENGQIFFNGMLSASYLKKCAITVTVLIISLL